MKLFRKIYRIAVEEYRERYPIEALKDQIEKESNGRNTVRRDFSHWLRYIAERLATVTVFKWQVYALLCLVFLGLGALVQKTFGSAGVLCIASGVFWSFVIPLYWKLRKIRSKDEILKAFSGDLLSLLFGGLICLFAGQVWEIQILVNMAWASIGSIIMLSYISGDKYRLAMHELKV